MLSKLLCLATVAVASAENAPVKPATRELDASVRIGNLFFWYDLFNETSTTYPSTTIEENSTQAPAVIPIEDNQTTTFAPTTTTVGPTTTGGSTPTTTTVAANTTTVVTTTVITTTTAGVTTTDPNATTTEAPATIETVETEFGLTLDVTVTEAQCVERGGPVEKLCCGATESVTGIANLEDKCSIKDCETSRRALSETSAYRRQLSTNSTTIKATVQFAVSAAQKTAVKTAITSAVSDSSAMVAAMTTLLSQPAVQTLMTAKLGSVPSTPTGVTVTAPQDVTVSVMTTGTWTAMMYTDAACTTAASPASATGAIGSGCVSGLSGNIKVAMCSNEVTASLYSDTTCNTATGAIVVHSTTDKFRPNICEKFSSTIYLKFTCAAAGGGSTSGAVGTGLSALATIAGLLMM